LTLLCEWDNCTHIYDNIDVFIDHVKFHLQHLTYDRFVSGSSLCLWRDCAHEGIFVNFDEFKRHVFYHAFHQKIKNVGLVAIMMNKSHLNINKCVFDNDNRNVIPDLPFDFVCQWQGCGKKFEIPYHFYVHVSSHITNYELGDGNKSKWRCHWDTCEYSAFSKHKLKCHSRSHTQEKLVACPTCGGVFSNATKFFDHILRQTTFHALTYKCSFCGKMFSTEKFLKDHMRHHGKNLYKCPYCDMTCPNPSSLRTHIQYRHTEERPYSCEQCQFKGKVLVDLKRHMECHTKAWIECQEPGCDYRTKFVWELNLHNKNKHQGDVAKYSCHLCSHKYTRGTFLTTHLKKMHKLKEPSGHVRLRYKQHDDGYYRLQEFRYESSELREQLI
ncbi:hypothetical protein HELRODRAFT_129823, partial [Helobdella robusta]|uniref:C2H2-type domain-containing protein n=1 Tax=Helobdella robusta TaxID=6412 RepID=T1EHS4_HELRO